MSISYKNPPIKEAVLDLKFVFEKEVGAELFEELYTKLQKEYPRKEVLNMQTVAFKIGNTANNESNQVNAQQRLQGIRLTSVDGFYIVQLKTDGVTFSRIEPYLGWSNFLPEAEKVITAYVEVLKPKYINRLATRFINLINIKETTFDISEYFKTMPVLANGISADIKGFFMRQVLESKNDGVTAIINQTTQTVLQNETAGIVFDIDVYKQDINIQFKSKEYNELITKLKDFRSKIFEESLTDKTKRLFN